MHTYYPYKYLIYKSINKIASIFLLNNACSSPSYDSARTLLKIHLINM